MRNLLTAVLCLSIPVQGIHGECVLHSADEITRACQERKTDCPIDVTGQLLATPVHVRIGFPVDVNGKIITFSDNRTNRLDVLNVGDHVRILGCTKNVDEGTWTIPLCNELHVLSSGTLPPSPHIDIREFQSGKYVNRRIAVNGRIKDVFSDDIDQRFAFIVLESSGRQIYLVYSGLKDQIPAFRSLIGSDVVATGVGLKDGLGMRQRFFANQSLSISGTNALTIVHRPDTDRFNVENLDLGTQSGLHAFSSAELRKTCGTVLATWHNDSCLVRTIDGAVIKVELAEPPLPRIGMVIEVVGLPETDLFDLGLSRAFWRQTGHAPVENEVPFKTSIRNLFTNKVGARTVRVTMHGKLLNMSGIVKSILVNERGGRRFLLEDGEFSILVDCEALPDVFTRVHADCAVDVTGICIRDGDVWRANVEIPRVRGLFLVPRTADDIRVISEPPWWTPARFAWTLIVLLAMIIGILAWNVSLRTLVARKSRALLKEQAEKLSETLKIDERTRLAAELHDFHCQNLTAISYQLSSICNACKNGPLDIVEQLNTAIRMLRSCRTDLRRCLWDLRNDVLDENDYEEAIRQTISPVIGDATLSVRFNGRRSGLSDTTAHTILSILRELSANARNHGHATAIRIAGERKPDAIRFSIQDNGIGFNPESAPGQEAGHFGLDGVRARLSHLNGTMTIDSKPTRGTYIRLTICSQSKETRQP